MKPLLTVDEVAEMLRVEPATVLRLVERDELTAYRVEDQYRFSEDAILDYLARQRLPGQKQDPGGTLSKFSRPARMALEVAQREAVRLHHAAIDPLHILLGMLSEGNGIAAQVLTQSGLALSLLSAEVSNQGRAAVNTPTTPLVAGPTLAPSTKRMIEAGVEAARSTKSPTIGTGHLLLGLIRTDEDGLLAVLGLDAKQVRQETLAAVNAFDEG